MSCGFICCARFRSQAFDAGESLRPQSDALQDGHWALVMGAFIVKLWIALEVWWESLTQLYTKTR